MIAGREERPYGQKSKTTESEATAAERARREAEAGEAHRQKIKSGMTTETFKMDVAKPKAKKKRVGVNAYEPDNPFTDH